MSSPRNPQYILEMNDSQAYPFKGVKNPHFEVLARCKVDFDEGGKIHASIQKIISVDSPHVIKVLEIVESYLTNSYTLTYEYVPYRVQYSH